MGDTFSRPIRPRKSSSPSPSVANQMCDDEAERPPEYSKEPPIPAPDERRRVIDAMFPNSQNLTICGGTFSVVNGPVTIFASERPGVVRDASFNCNSPVGKQAPHTAQRVINRKGEYPHDEGEEVERVRSLFALSSHRHISQMNAGSSRPPFKFDPFGDSNEENVIQAGPENATSDVEVPTEEERPSGK
ncbi:hypothetical protein CVT26_006566 [Gymnopilus dilepis]|uniref:Uncharacterized protein n=1 Tax=Gymnopilus dilepis TaxID=231916 RepID=A0A409Y2W5_9AGAR|nr:hypothetical protein CVT26_006566 [Gymnopilus dilepis]